LALIQTVRNSLRSGYRQAVIATCKARLSVNTIHAGSLPIVAVAVLFFGAIGIQPQQRREEMSASRVDELIKRVDSNGDGAVSLDEARSIGRFRNAAQFGIHDTDGDRMLSREEFEAMNESTFAGLQPPDMSGREQPASGEPPEDESKS
jgi:hypothetical protein